MDGDLGLAGTSAHWVATTGTFLFHRCATMTVCSDFRRLAVRTSRVAGWTNCFHIL